MTDLKTDITSKQNTPNFPDMNIYTFAYQGVRNIPFWKSLTCFVFLLTLRFVLLPTPSRPFTCF